MLAIERRNRILEKLQKDKRVVVSELSRLYQVSEETIRRDLEKLENDGLVIKSYGGAVLNEHSIFDLPFNIRKNQMIAEKQRIASMIADMVRDGEAIMLDASSTAVYIAKGLKDKKNLTLITNSMEIVIELLDMSDWRVLSTGGVSREGSFALVGTQTNRMLQSYHADKAIISCKGLDMAAGLTDSDELLADNKRTMLENAKERILAIDSSKFGATAFMTVGRLKDITMIVTDEKPEMKWLKEFKKLGIECIYPE